MKIAKEEAINPKIASSCPTFNRIHLHKKGEEMRDKAA